MEVLDNISKLLGDDLKGTVRSGAKVRIAASSFSIYAFEALRRELENVQALDFIFTTPTFVAQEATDKVARAPGSSTSPRPAANRSSTGPSSKSGSRTSSPSGPSRGGAPTGFVGRHSSGRTEAARLCGSLPALKRLLVPRCTCRYMGLPQWT